MRGPLDRIFIWGSRLGSAVMAEAVTFAVELRDPQKNKGTGTRVARRLRAQGRVPAIVYGHKQAPQTITISRDDVWKLIKKSVHLAELKFGDATEMVLVRDVQWDHLGKEIIHLDFARVSADESIETEVRLELHGTPVGVAAGGILEVLVHSVEITCRAGSIPDFIRAEVSGLEVGGGLHVRDLVLPEGVVVNADADQLLAHVVLRAVAPEPAPAAAEEGGAEPELIGRKAEDKDKEKEETK
jgi:large subunit ribosomal protein L25